MEVLQTGNRHFLQWFLPASIVLNEAQCCKITQTNTHARTLLTSRTILMCCSTVELFNDSTLSIVKVHLLSDSFRQAGSLNIGLMMPPLPVSLPGSCGLDALVPIYSQHPPSLHRASEPGAERRIKEVNVEYKRLESEKNRASDY